MLGPCSDIGTQTRTDKRTCEETKQQESFCPILSPPENHVSRCYRAYVVEGEQGQEDKSGNIQPEATTPGEPGHKIPKATPTVA
jgi:hypothetical protein